MRRTSCPSVVVQQQIGQRRGTAADRVKKRNTTNGTLTDTRIREGAFQLCFGACRKAASIWRSFRISVYEFWCIIYELQLIPKSATQLLVCLLDYSF